MKPSTMSLLLSAAPRARRTGTRWITAALALVANTAWAADCNMQLSNREVNYGALHRGELAIGAQGTSISLGKRQLTLTVLCRQPTAIGLRFDALSAGIDSYRFGEKGSFTVRIGAATVDGQPVQLAALSGSGDSGMPSSTAILKPNGMVVVSPQGTGATGRSFTAQVEIDTYLDDAASRVRDLTVQEGNGTFRLVFR